MRSPEPTAGSGRNRSELALARASRAERGFTLLELLVVLVIMAVTAVLVVPSVRSGSQQREVRRTVQRFVAAVRACSSSAIRRRATTSLAIHLDDRVFGVTGGTKEVELPSFAEFGDVTGGRMNDQRTSVEFPCYPTGGSSGGSVELVFEPSGGRQAYLMTIDPLLTSVDIEQLR